MLKWSRVFTFVLLASIPLKLSSAGGWVSGGGSGMLCFQQAKDFENFQQKKLSSKEIATLIKNKSATLQTLEHWEASLPSYTANLGSNEGLHFLRWINSGLSTQDMLKQFMGEMKKYSPIFYDRLLLIHQSIPMNTWKDDGFIEEIKDANPWEKPPPQCAVVQLVRRLNLPGDGKVPPLKVEYNKTLVDVMESFDQVFLISHEYLYAILREINSFSSTAIVKTSDHVRRANAVIFCDSFFQSLQDIEQFESYGQAAQLYQLNLSQAFGDYFLYFVKDEAFEKIATENPKNYNQYTRHKSYYSLLNNLRAAIEECEKDPQKYIKAEIVNRFPQIKTCKDFVMFPPETNLHVKNDEEAFLLMLRWPIEQRGQVANTERLVVWDRDSKNANPTAEQKALLRHACTKIGDYKETAYFNVVPRAQKYCEALGF